MAGPPNPPAARSTVPHPLSRRRPPPTGDEETTSILRLGEYTDVPCLSVSEANTILQKVIEARNKPDESGRKPPGMPSSDVFTKTEIYLKLFARFNGEQAVQQVESVSSKLVGPGGITGFERAQLGTLCCDTVEEARTLIPSLEGKVSDDDLQQVLDDISKLRDFS
ncbi:RNA polymerase B [Saxophila tyrrhenica]|uniref:RNA polymerase B n=1 Tax=Saxophila tyrrhenica TaxID=1690608 RepID=A0AAV9PKN6_9PEZI|nr:RNA polymerase B [Saxophila tyrrhenica]